MNVQFNMQAVWRKGGARAVLWAGVAASGIFNALAFAPFQHALLIWVALLPGLLAAARLPPRRALLAGWLSGCVFWLYSLFWLTRVTWAGWFFLSLYCALYHAPLFGFLAWWKARRGVQRIGTNLAGMLLAAAVWTGFEYLRSVFATGFAWNTLGTALSTQPAIMQAARLGGVYLLSALVVWMNAGAAFTLWRFVGRRAHPGGALGRAPVELLLAMACWAGALGWGTHSLLNEPPEPRSMRVALVQPNIPQEQKWLTGQFTREEYEAHGRLIHERLHLLTAPVSRLDGVELIVWPETAIPDDLLYSRASYDLVLGLVTNGVPILLGSMDTEVLDGGKERLYYNCAFLVETNGVVVKAYDKQHLVIFGEYVPFRDAIPFIKAMTPIQESFTAGTNSTIFVTAGSEVPFGVLICFEDTVSQLARKAVRRGARMLVNQTNDAWFDPLSGSLQHLAHSIMRAVECGVPVVRSANTGVTGAIDRRGRVLDVVQDDQGRMVRLAGVIICDVPVPGDEMPMTWYVRVGDAPWQAVCLLAIGLLAVVLRDSRSSRYVKKQKGA